MSATQQGVENHRRSLMDDIVKGRTASVVQELKDASATPEDIASLTGTPPEVPLDDPKRPQGVSAEEWSKMSDEDKGNAIASATESETDDQRAEREAKEAQAKVDEETKSAEAAAKPKIKGKVDGKEVEFDQDTVLEAGLRTLQKETAADRRLEEATRTRDEVERLKQRVEDLSKAKAADAPQKTDQEMMAAKEGLRGIVKKIQYGSEDEAADALLEYGTKMAAMGQSGRLTATELQNILDLREAQAFVKTNYADVMGDENLKELFVGKVNKKLAAGDARPYQEICKETGDELRAWKAPAKTTPTPSAGGGRAEAQERKTKTISIPAAGSRLPAATPTKEPSPSDTIEKMRLARGQK